MKKEVKFIEHSLIAMSGLLGIVSYLCVECFTFIDYPEQILETATPIEGRVPHHVFLVVYLRWAKPPDVKDTIGDSVMLDAKNGNPKGIN